ncbi:MAG: polysaccharide deacetylase family protein [Actinobacteria bacterium]|nr:MAG: polysaccharide deacetylase family protein [Actinomycetota bacterium]
MRPALVLAYHGLGTFPKTLDPHNLMLDPARFRRQVLTLMRRRYGFVTLSELVEHLDRGTPPDGVCALTFDDGTADNVELLAPLLEELEIPATVFACPGLLGADHFAMPAAARVRLMDAGQLRALACSPLVDIGSHTSTHVDLSSATGEEAYEEMASSKRALEDLLQRPVNFFAYPKCGYSPSCPDAARRAGYLAAVTCAGLGGWRRFELTRVSIDSLDRRLSFALKSRGLFAPLRNSPPGKLARALARPLRHHGAD